MQAVILAAGRGKRLRPITTRRNKALVEIWGKPLVAWVIEGLLSVGLRSVILVIDPLDRDPMEKVVRGYQATATFEIAQDPIRKGMVPALEQATPWIQGDFLLTACDSGIPRRDLRGMLTKWKGLDGFAGLLATQKIPIRKTRAMSAVVVDGDQIKRVVEKPDPKLAPSQIASISPYIFRSRLLEFLPKITPSARGEFELQDAIQKMIDGGHLVQAYPVKTRWNVTTMADWMVAHLRLVQFRVALK